MVMEVEERGVVETDVVERWMVEKMGVELDGEGEG